MVEEYFDAYSKFDQMLTGRAAATSLGMPKVTEPKVASIIATLSDSERFLVKPDFRLEHLGVLMDVCGKANRAVMSYTLFDLKSHVDAKTDPAMVASQVSKIMVHNIHTFQNELKLLMPFHIRCLARQIPLVTEFTSNLKLEDRTDIRRAGLQQAQRGIFSVISGAILLATCDDESLTESFRTAILQAVADNSSQFAAVLPISDRQKIIALIVSPQTVIPPFAQKYFTTISAAMSDSNCTGLCNYRFSGKP
jgi:hypothetical protein